MQWVFAIVVIFYLLDIQDKIKKLSEKLDNSISESSQNKNLVLSEYLNKDVYIVLKDDVEMSEQHLFFAGQKNKGKIIDFDNEWLMLKLKKKKENIIYYIKINDIESIDEIN